MKKFFQSHIVTTGLAIFSMFFGAGNLMYPLEVGMESVAAKSHGVFLDFLLTAACLPVLGLFAMILFDGDYKAFFNQTWFNRWLYHYLSIIAHHWTINCNTAHHNTFAHHDRAIHSRSLPTRNHPYIIICIFALFSLASRFY